MGAAEEAFTEGHGNGLLSLKDFKTAVKGSKHPALMNSFRKLSADQAEKVFDVATDKEKQALLPFLARKQRLAGKKTLDRGARSV